MLNCLGVPIEVFVNLQKRAKEFANVSYIHKKLSIRAKKLTSLKGKDTTYKELSAQLHLTFGPGRWFSTIFK
jgi:hypothetical protein